MSENKTGKYFKYAIGEIVLVVIGILIALQINNWNEQRKTKDYETKMLYQVRKDLILDTIYFNAVKARPMRVDKAVDKLINMKIKNIIHNDSIGLLFETTGTTMNYSYHSGAYESIRSVGLDRISNDSLRNHIAEMYDFTFPRGKDLIESFQKEASEDYRQTLNTFFVYDVFNKNRSRPILKLKLDSKLLFDEPQFANTLYLSKAYAVNTISRIEGLVSRITRLLQHIDSELQIEDPTKNLPNVNWD